MHSQYSNTKANMGIYTMEEEEYYVQHDTTTTMLHHGDYVQDDEQWWVSAQHSTLCQGQYIQICSDSDQRMFFAIWLTTTI